MATHTMRLALILIYTAPHILPMRYYFQMCRIHAIPDSAQMVNFFAFRYLPNHYLVYNTMWLMHPSTY